MHRATRESGVILHISSLPGPFGIGTFGPEARLFVDRLQAAGVTWWQVLPFTVPGSGYSPYASISVMAGNPWFIDPRGLVTDGLLTQAECDRFADHSNSPYSVDFAFVSQNHDRLLRLAFSRIDAGLRAEIRRLVDQSSWLFDFAAYNVIKDYYGGQVWWQWPDEALRRHDADAVRCFAAAYPEAVDYVCFVQWLFNRQWRALKQYANDRGVGILGDMPLYVDRDSSDVWANVAYFQLDADLEPIGVSGVPPDYFSKNGQLWGSPLYDWDAMAADGYSWWVNRLHAALTLYDRVRIDHFRGLESYWAIPADAQTAKTGCWHKGPAMQLLNAVRSALGEVDIAAEDLGDIDDDVRDFLRDSGFPGMKVFQFAFRANFDDSELPHRYIPNLCAYTGTHDNQTTLGWLMGLSESERRYVLDYIGFPPDGDWMRGGEDAPALRAILRTVWSSAAGFAAAPMQDILGYGDDTRMNTPGIANGNWTFRIGPNVLETWDPGWLRQFNRLYGRLTPYVSPPEAALLNG